MRERDKRQRVYRTASGMMPGEILHNTSDVGKGRRIDRLARVDTMWVVDGKSNHGRQFYDLRLIRVRKSDHRDMDITPVFAAMDLEDWEPESWEREGSGNATERVHWMAYRGLVQVARAVLEETRDCLGCDTCEVIVPMLKLALSATDVAPGGE